MAWQLYPIAEFKQFANLWDKLNTNSGNTPLLDSDFVLPLLEVFSTRRELLAIHGGIAQPGAMAVVQKVKAGRWSTFQPSQSPLGLWLQQDNQSLEQLTYELRKCLPGLVLQFSVTQQDPDLLPRPENSTRFSTLDYIETARVPVAGTFEDYWSSRGKNLRQNLRRQRNRLQRENVETALNIITDSSYVYNAIKTYGEIESVGWKSETNTAVAIDNEQGMFYKKLLERFCGKNKGYIFQYLYDGEVKACDLCIANKKQLVILKTTYDETISTSSPAMLMREESFKYIFDLKISEYIEFYGKVMDWHKRWSDSTRTLYHSNLLSRKGTFIRIFMP